MNNKIVTFLSAAFILAAATSCGVDSREVINQKYPVEAVNLTKITSIDGVYFYVPDEHLNSKDNTTENGYYLKDDDFLVEVRRMNASAAIDDLAALSSFFSGQFSENIYIKQKLEDGKFECILRDDEKNGYIKTVNDEYAILCVSDDDKTASTIADSLKLSETKKIADGKTESVNIDDDLSASVNGVEIGSALSVEDIQNDFAQMGANFESMKEDLSNINGSSIRDINHKVIMQFNAIESTGKEAQQAYLNSVAAYKDAVSKYNVELSNGINLNSTKEEIQKVLKIDLSPEWERIVINNQNKTSDIRKIIIEYNNEKDSVESIIINDINEIKNEVSNREQIRDKMNEEVSKEPIRIPEGIFDDNSSGSKNKSDVVNEDVLSDIVKEDITKSDNDPNTELGLQGINK
ncbi:hypothetical protein [Ruminococcus albus]|uniref:Uncharacterized protein n=1 Tax=Ruminococcus albus (strain ATCC 27210 / DSM 20455 / JCM 14654 / NCDO 2250 / 7) TaxID=697329 RepID=E6UKA7_RUMA7|nr:hypothetical protein [Ruminococcus albus]ADU24103.1 hypothetical protein Rumal_3664 [Ruminococcus albus 7 = DSM 20455]